MTTAQGTGLKGKRQGDWRQWQPPLFLQQYWVVRLRWLAGFAVVALGVLNWREVGWFAGTGVGVMALGGAILGYNVGLWGLMWRRRAVRWKRWQLQALAWVQMVLDLACLTVLTVWTGGFASPVLGFYVFHMVFASLLLPRVMAYAVAALAVAGATAALYVTGQWPASGDRVAAAGAVGWGLALLGTVHFANHIVRHLRQQRRRVVRQNRRIKAMARRLHEQREMMAHHEKMVAMGQMAAGVAHEVANPLASMDGLLQLMERRPERIRPDAVARLREQVARINQIVRQMTAFARPGEGQWEKETLNNVAMRALEVVRFDPRLKKVEVEHDLAVDMPAVSMLPAAMEQVVINLVINALDALEGVSSPRLTIRTVRDERSCMLEVKDNGSGISEADAKRVFEPFFTTKPVGKGTGLGLSISYALVRKHGGEIRLVSSPGSGATFQITLPLARAATTWREGAQQGLMG